jgi:DNA polymerase-4
MARGIDGREVITEHERKSVGAETTFARDLPAGPELRAELSRIAAEVSRRLVGAHARGRTVALKLRYSYFKTITRQATLPAHTDDASTIERVAHELLTATARPEDEFRLIGISLTNLVDEHGVQGVLWRDEMD